MFANGQDALNVVKPIIDTAMDTDSLAFTKSPAELIAS